LTTIYCVLPGICPGNKLRCFAGDRIAEAWLELAVFNAVSWVQGSQGRLPSIKAEAPPVLLNSAASVDGLCCGATDFGCPVRDNGRALTKLNLALGILSSRGHQQIGGAAKHFGAALGCGDHFKG